MSIDTYFQLTVNLHWQGLIRDPAGLFGYGYSLSAYSDESAVAAIGAYKNEHPKCLRFGCSAGILRDRLRINRENGYGSEKTSVEKPYALFAW